jgi:hypothetical protein
MNWNIDLQSVRPAGLQPAEFPPELARATLNSGVQLRWAHRPQAYVPPQ